MLAVKAALSQKPETDHDEEDGERISDWGIMDDLWITRRGGLMLYRTIRLQQPWEKNLKRNGHTYWSTSNRGAEPYDAADTWEKGMVDVKLIAELQVNSGVDWDDIWEMILHYHHVGEDEVRFGSGVPLIVRYIYVEGQEVQSPWIGKTLSS